MTHRLLLFIIIIVVNVAVLLKWFIIDKPTNQGTRYKRKGGLIFLAVVDGGALALWLYLLLVFA